MTPEEQVVLDLTIYGTAFTEMLDSGERRRIDPGRVVVHGSPLSLLGEMDQAGDWVAGFHSSGSSQHLKVAKEAAEFAENPCLEEAADVLITLAGSARLEGWTWGELAQAVRAKMHINRARTWARLEDGTWQHT